MDNLLDELDRAIGKLCFLRYRIMNQDIDREDAERTLSQISVLADKFSTGKREKKGRLPSRNVFEKRKTSV